MLIDWFTVGAQAVNFLILVWLMRRFLYKPVLNAIDAREQRIAAQIAAADARQSEAQTERDTYQRKNEEFEQQRSVLLHKATDEANAQRQRLMDSARTAADEMSAKRLKHLREEAGNLNEALTRRTQHEVFAIARKTLSDLATASLEERMCDVFTRRLRELDEPARANLGQAFRTASEPALVRSAFPLTSEQCAAISKALNETFSANLPLRFEAAPELVSGIELSVNGQKLGWSIAEYLKSVQKNVEELIGTA